MASSDLVSDAFPPRRWKECKPGGCPNDTDGDGDCGRPGCPHCGACRRDARARRAEGTYVHVSAAAVGDDGRLVPEEQWERFCDAVERLLAATADHGGHLAGVWYGTWSPGEDRTARRRAAERVPAQELAGPALPSACWAWRTPDTDHGRPAPRPTRRARIDPVVVVERVKSELDRIAGVYRIAGVMWSIEVNPVLLLGAWPQDDSPT
jgi:hypothetical protein